MRKYEFLMILFLIVLTIFVVLSKKEKQHHCIELCTPDIEYTMKYIRSADTTSIYNTFKLDKINLTSKPDKFEINFIDRIVKNLIKQKKYRTGIVIDVSKTSYSGFVGVLDIFIKNKIRQVCFENDKLYYFPCRPPKEFMRNRFYINKNFQVIKD